MTDNYVMLVQNYQKNSQQCNRCRCLNLKTGSCCCLPRTKKMCVLDFFAFSTVSKNRHKNANVSTLIQHLGLELVPGKNSQFRNVHIGRSHQCLSLYLESLVTLVSEVLHRMTDWAEKIFRLPGLFIKSLDRRTTFKFRQKSYSLEIKANN